ncbi:MAG: DNA-processing protein DprA [bacterium]
MMPVKDWIRLAQTPSLGPSRIKKLWEHFKSIDLILSANKGTLSEIDGIGEATAEAIAFNWVNHQVNIDLAQYSDLGISIITLDDPKYPKMLYEIYDPPPMLFIKGSNILNNRSIAVVGTRAASPYGMRITRDIVRELSPYTIVSGLASGIDTQAHRAALESNNLTVAVLAAGLDTIYPPANRGLARSIIESGGCLISECHIGQELGNWSFPRRNRMISGLSLGTVIVEAGESSGALITACAALEQGRDVFAVPGPIDCDKSIGTNRLIQGSGAKLIRNAQDILDEYGDKAGQGVRIKKELNLGEIEIKLLDDITYEAKYIDEIAASSGINIREVSTLITILELKGLIEKMPGKKYRSLAK